MFRVDTPLPQWQGELLDIIRSATDNIRDESNTTVEAVLSNIRTAFDEGIMLAVFFIALTERYGILTNAVIIKIAILLCATITWLGIYAG